VLIRHSHCRKSSARRRSNHLRGFKIETKVWSAHLGPDIDGHQDRGSALSGQTDRLSKGPVSSTKTATQYSRCDRVVVLLIERKETRPVNLRS
jgi:hypothetical protein